MTSTTRLEVDGKKFWEAVVEGKTVTLNFGKIGKEGKSSKFEYDTEEEAKKFAIERAEIKRSRGYKDVEVVKSNTKGEGSKASTEESKKKRKRYSDDEESGEDWAELDEKIDADEVDTSLIISGSRRPKRRAAANAEVIIRSELKANPGKDGDDDDDDELEL